MSIVDPVTALVHFNVLGVSVLPVAPPEKSASNVVPAEVQPIYNANRVLVQVEYWSRRAGFQTNMGNAVGAKALVKSTVSHVTPEMCK